MKFFSIIDELKKKFNDDMEIRANDTVLFGLDKTPRARHMIFKPLDDKLIEEFLISQCVNKFPPEYINFLKYSNGANLCSVRVWHSIRKKRIATAYSLFTIFGLPRTPPYGRAPEMEEPFDLRIEDLGRHDLIPQTWLKCGSYIRNYNFHEVIDIFIDTESEKVYACVNKENNIVDSWETLDDCFCSIYNSLSNAGFDYEFNP